MKRLVLATLLLIALGGTSFSTEPPKAGASGMYRSGIEALRQGRLEEALSLLSQAAESEPENYRLYNDRAVANRRAGKLEAALADANKSLLIKPDYTYALNNRGVIYRSMCRYDLAIKDFTKALKHKGLKGKIYRNRGIAYAKMGDHKKAIRDYVKAAHHLPANAQVFRLLGESLEKMGRYGEALKAYHLASGLTDRSDRAVQLEKKILELEKRTQKPKPRIVKRAVEPKPTVRKKPKKKKKSARTTLHRKRSAREIAATAPRSLTQGTIMKGSHSGEPASIRSIEELDELFHVRASRTFSPVASDIYEQGKRFLAESDIRKALVRFEDVFELAKRRNNRLGVALCLLEMGRIYFRLGHYSKALQLYSSSLKVLRSIKARDESILVLNEMAKTSKARGQVKKSVSYNAEAIRSAKSAQHAELAATLKKNVKKPSKVTRRTTSASADRPKETAKKKRSITYKRARRADRRPKTIKQYVADLRKHKEKGRVKEMVVTLERLGGKYRKRKQYEKELHCLSSAVGFREKIGFLDGLQGTLLKLGLVREKLKQYAAAMESYTRASTMSQSSRSKIRTTASKRSKIVARALGMNPQPLISSLGSLWKVRTGGDLGAEIGVLHHLGSLYARAGHHSQALNYFERSAAIMLLERARMYDKLEKAEQADKAYRNALKALKKLDYSGYVRAKKELQSSKRVSLQ